MASKGPSRLSGGTGKDQPTRNVTVEVIPSRPTCYRITLENIYGETLVIFKRYSEIRHFYDQVQGRVTLVNPSSLSFPAKTCCSRYSEFTINQRKQYFQTFFKDLVAHNPNLGITLVRRFTGMREL